MNIKSVAPGSPEPERYELYAMPAYRFALGRREFCKLLGGGFVVVLSLAVGIPQDADAQESGGSRRRGRQAPQQIQAWLHIGPDSTVTVYTGKVEVGQNIRTSLGQAVAEELHAPLASIHLVMGDTDLTPFDMGTFGSRTTPTMGLQLRKAAAAAREILVGLAADRWKVDRASLMVVDGKVSNPKTGESLEFGVLAGGKPLAGLADDGAIPGPAASWKVEGAAVSKVDMRAFVTGKHIYTSDMTRPGMLYGKVVRPDYLNSTLIAVDSKEAEAIPGAAIVRDGSFVGVTAPDPYSASRAAEAVHAEWKAPAQASGKDLFDQLKRQASPGEPQVVGSMDAGLAAAAVKLQRSYTVAYIAHAPLEPRAAVAEWQDGKLTVWTGTQRPFGVRSELAAAFGVPEDQVRVIVPDTGSAYGGKHTGEAAVEAARLARAAGKPVKLVWTREEEFTWAYFRPAGVIEIRSGAQRDGMLAAWEQHNYNSGAAGIRTPYEVPNQHSEFRPVDAPLRQGSYRALASTANHFARESHMDELAVELKMDPLAFRLKNLKEPRLRAVFEAASDRFGWAKWKPAAGHGIGMGGGTEKGGFLATCAEVAVDERTGVVKVVRVVSAFECGAIVNPAHLRSQVEGAAMMGLGGALFEAVEFENGKILNGHFSRYRVPRFGDAPVIDVVLLDRKDLPSAGAGECPIIGIAPAIGNAIASATGARIRSLPMGRVQI